MTRHRHWRRDVPPAHLDRLGRALAGEDPEVPSTTAGQRLARSRVGMRRLVRVVLSSADLSSRLAALYEFLTARLAPWHLALLGRVFADPHAPPLLRALAAEGLGVHLPRLSSRRRPRRRDARLLDALHQGLVDPEPEVRFWCIYALTNVGDARCLPRLRLIAATDTASASLWTLRQEALWALGRFEGRDLDPHAL